MQPFVLDPTFGIGGKATASGIGGDRSSMALQPDGKVVLAGGEFTAFVLARFDVDGTLDESFGTDGIVTTEIGSEFSIEEALGVAVQPDGKIVAVGYTGSDVTVARYLTDGQLDEGFGTEGIVTGILPGRANDVIVDSEDRIVVVGQADVDDPLGDDFSDFFVARLLPDGQPDVSFGLAGQVITDLGGVTNEGQNVVIQPADGKIVVSGSTRAPGTLGFVDDHYTDVARYTSEGQLDSTFGAGGTLTLAGLVGKDLAIQDDGRLLLVGTADTTPPAAPAGSVTELAVLRLEPGGTPDTTFGTEGTATVSVTGLTSSNGMPGRDIGSAIALPARRAHRGRGLRHRYRLQPQVRGRSAALRRRARHRLHRHRRDDDRLLRLHRPRRKRRHHHRRQDRRVRAGSEPWGGLRRRPTGTLGQRYRQLIAADSPLEASELFRPSTARSRRSWPGMPCTVIRQPR